MSRKVVLLMIALIAYCHPVPAMEKGWRDFAIEGQTHYQNGHYQQAARAYTKALELNPHDPRLYNNLGDRLREQEKFERSIEIYDKGLRLDQKKHIMHYNKGLLQVALNDQSGARQSFEAAVTHNPNYGNAHIALGNIRLNANAFDAALASYNQTISVEPDNGEAYFSRAVLYGQLQKFNEGLKDANKALSLNPRLAKAYMLRGALKGQIGKEVEALVDLLKGCQIDPSYYLCNAVTQ